MRTTGKQYILQYDDLVLNPHLLSPFRSCSPNATWKFDPKSFAFSIQAGREIKEGEEITIAYVDLLQPTAVRQKGLEWYGFKCACKACTDPESDARRAKIRLPHSKHYDPSMGPMLQDIDQKTDPVAYDLSMKRQLDSYMRESVTQLLLLEKEELWEVAAYRQHQHVLVGVHRARGNTKQEKFHRSKLPREDEAIGDERVEITLY